ncbi:biotin/lipoyl-containing protein [Alteromonas lipotrueae]|uniref:biotin/lipoyl-containing protein n=1 Tax=Alteromonas lipotrueae TaxID=2803814 RepID=UPI001C44DD0D|nr:biotin/lipoyl-containing protein [Alteromonas lipotrueae]
MNTEIKIPQLPESTNSANIIRIYVNEGQEVEYDQALFDIETEKVVLEVVSPSAGVVEGFNISQGEQVVSEQVAMNLRVKANSDTPAESKKIEYIETIVEKKVKEDSDRLLLEETIGNSLFDKRGQICGLFGFVIGIIIGVIGTVVVLG